MTLPATERSERRRTRIGIALFVFFLAVVVVALLWGRLVPDTETVEIRGIVGSESATYLSDPQVLDALRVRGFDLSSVERSGSFDIPTRGDLDVFDFALTSSDPAGRELQAQRGVPAIASPFSSPVVVVTYPAVRDTLARAGVIAPGFDGAPVLDIEALSDLVSDGARWGDLPGNTVPAPTRAVLLSTTDPRFSNSAAMFLALTSYALNGDRVLTSPADVGSVMPRLCPMTRDQGAKQPSSQFLFEQFLGGSMGSMPMALVYENQVLAAQASGQWPADRLVLFPSPTVQSQYTMVPLRDSTRALGQALIDDPVLVRRAADLGFRPANPSVRPTGAPPLPSDVVPTPSFATLQALRAAVVEQCS